MGFFDLFKRKKNRGEALPSWGPLIERGERTLPSREEIVEMMCRERLDDTENEKVLNVIYSRDKWYRYVIVKSAKGFYTYYLEKIELFDEYDLGCIPADDAPAYWESADNATKHVFATVDELMRELVVEPEYKAFFETDKN
ncbi:MAG: hypothetical protein K2G44_00745 [Clostridia bacterium]|nr:hypothetical protein [Clostridia bacterium]